MTYRSIKALLVGLLLTLPVLPAAAAESAAEMISSFRLKHGEVRVTSDAVLNRIAQEQARAMATRARLDHEVAGSFSSRIAPSQAGRAAENIAYGYDTFERTLQQWIESSEHRKNLLLHNATRIGVASAHDEASHRTYWAMEIAGDYEPKPAKGRKGGPPTGERRVVAAVEAKGGASHKRSCHLKLLGLCL
ncbi:MAG: CAP domain-containing protein [Bradyrhizobium sp.]|uniref:CAP domain-containing protein n=1 Tax=Bradyrhizobium sp. TaxID=376 RepID=UPI001D5DA69C|nr:CAP domain-containing protein [Bradyrhizobium sp.]MBV9560409.1 CAP domain-containing protein [Bradyrhizobium sp.]